MDDAAARRIRSRWRKDFVRNQGDGWGWTLDFLARAAEEVGTIEDGEADRRRSAGQDYVRLCHGDLRADRAPRRAARRALATDAEAADFQPEPADAAVLAGWGDGAAIADRRRDRGTARRRWMAASWPRPIASGRANPGGDHAAALTATARALAAGGTGALRTRVHGDFHLGQVLVVQGDAFIIDFEGEPARTMEQRRARSPRRCATSPGCCARSTTPRPRRPAGSHRRVRAARRRRRQSGAGAVPHRRRAVLPGGLSRGA